MSGMKNEITNLRNQAIARLSSAKNQQELEKIRADYLGRNGQLTALFKNISKLPSREKKECGILINETKSTLLAEIASQENKLKSKHKAWFDPTLPGIKPQIGHTHLITQAIDEIAEIFEGIGFSRIRYPEVEWDYFAFESLNFPKDHPARDEWETFFVDQKDHPKYGPMLLTPHTSSSQVREMHRVKNPPIRMINISKCYRRQSDATHFPMFHQFEGLVIDKDINITHLKGIINYFAERFYGPGIISRIRPYNFQFTEPSFEVDFSCVHCNKTGCKFCRAGWHETGGAGMVHPNVLREGGIDPEKYSGFAFGWGVERALMLKSGIGINDIRTLYGTSLDYLTQF